MFRKVFSSGMLALALVVVVQLSEQVAEAQSNCFGFYQDVYGDGRWSWSSHTYPTYARAEEEAKRACMIGTKVSHIGNYCTGQVWTYACPGRTPVQPKPVLIEGYQFYYKQRGQWILYQGQIVNRRPLGACSSDTAKQWWREVVSVASQVNNVQLTNSNYQNYIGYRK